MDFYIVIDVVQVVCFIMAELYVGWCFGNHLNSVKKKMSFVEIRNMYSIFLSIYVFKVFEDYTVLKNAVPCIIVSNSKT